jgi:hypothetical protein
VNVGDDKAIQPDKEDPPSPRRDGRFSSHGRGQDALLLDRPLRRRKNAGVVRRGRCDGSPQLQYSAILSILNAIHVCEFFSSKLKFRIPSIILS